MCKISLLFINIGLLLQFIWQILWVILSAPFFLLFIGCISIAYGAKFGKRVASSIEKVASRWY